MLPHKFVSYSPSTIQYSKDVRKNLIRIYNYNNIGAKFVYVLFQLEILLHDKALKSKFVISKDKLNKKIWQTGTSKYLINFN